MNQYLQVLLAFLFVLGLIGILAVLLRKFPLSNIVMKIGQSDKNLLSILEVLPLDSKRKIVLIKSGKRKHLLLLGNSEIVLETIDE